MKRSSIAALCILAAFPALAEKRTLSCTIVAALDTHIGEDGIHRDDQFVKEPVGVRTTWIFEGDMLQIQSSDPDLVRSSTLRCKPNPDPEAAPSGVLCKRSNQLAKFTELPMAWTYTAKLRPDGGRMQRLETFACFDKDFGPSRGWLSPYDQSPGPDTFDPSS